MALSDYQEKRRKELQKTLDKTDLQDQELKAKLVKGLNNELSLLESVNLAREIAEEVKE